MNVLYLVFRALLGGHVLSASTIAQEMRTQGVSPVFAGAEGAMTEAISRDMPFESVTIPIFHGSRQTYFTWDSFSAVNRLRDIVRKHDIDLIHAFDARSYLHAYLAGLREQIPVLCTLCGGVDPYYNLPVAPTLIVFSEEQKQKMVKTFRWPAGSVEVVRTRLDMRLILSVEHQLGKDEALALGLNPNLPKIMMISSFDDTKIRSIEKVLDAAEMLFSKGVFFQLVLIGGKGPLHDQARDRAKAICERFGAGRVLLTGQVMRAFRLLQHADIVLGVGRSAFEGMVYGKPTLIIGEKGFAGVVSPETIASIAWYNFSGRNQIEDVSAEYLGETIAELLQAPDRCRLLGAFGRDFVFSEIDVARGVERLGGIYRRVTDAGAQIAPWHQYLSFSSCLVPIARDNGLQTFKQGAKRLFYKLSVPGRSAK